MCVTYILLHHNYCILLQRFILRKLFMIEECISIHVEIILLAIKKKKHFIYYN